MAVLPDGPMGATNETDLVDTVFASTNGVEWVDRQLLISALGTTLANKFLPPLLEYVAVNVEDFKTNVIAYKPELVPVTSS